MKKFFTMLALLGGLSAYAFTPGAEVESEGFSPAHIRPGSTTSYAITLKNISGNVSASDIPMPSGLQIVGRSSSQNYVINNSVASRSIVYTFTVLAQKEGNYSVPEWKLKIGSQEFPIPASVLKVSADAPEQQVQEDDDDAFGFPFRMMRQRQIQSRQQQHSYESSLRDKVKLELQIPKQKIYVGEALPCKLVFSIDKSLIEGGLQLQQLIPQIKKADDFDCTPFGKPTEDLSDAGKIKYSFDTVITPLKVGKYKIDFFAEGVFLRNVGMDDLMNMSFADRFAALGFRQQFPFQVHMQDMTLDILPLPEQGRPKNFSGAIGNFSLEKTGIDTDALTVGEPCVVSASIVGSGNFNRVGAPELTNTADWKTYKPKSSFKDESSGMGYVGIKTFACTVVPQKPDLKFAPSASFSYFDPTAEKYVSLQSKPISVSVAPSGRSRKIEKEEQQSTEPTFGKIIEEDSARESYKIFSSPIFWGVQAAAVIAVAAFVVARRKRLRLQNDPAFAKLTACTKKADILAKAAISSASKGDARGFFEAARGSLQNMAAARSELDAAAILAKEAQERFSNAGCDADTLAQIREIFDGADAMTFGNLSVSNADLDRLSKALVRAEEASKKFGN